MLLTLLRFNRIRDDKGRLALRNVGLFQLIWGGEGEILNNQRHLNFLRDTAVPLHF